MGVLGAIYSGMLKYLGYTVNRSSPKLDQNDHFSKLCVVDYVVDYVVNRK